MLAGGASVLTLYFDCCATHSQCVQTQTHLATSARYVRGAIGMVWDTQR